MKPVDPRLLREAPAARRFLLLCGVLGLTAAVAVIAQAVALGSLVANVFIGHQPLGEQRTQLAVLLAAAIVRGALAWALESGGRLTALRVGGELRARVLRHVLAARPGGLPDAPGSLAAAVVTGLDALDPYFARFLPQLVLSAVVPAAIFVWVAWHDWTSALVMALTLPLVPIFGVLIGKVTARRTMRRFETLSLLSGHFLDVVRGLPTLRAFGRGRAQGETIARVSEAYRAETMGTLRVAFLSALVLELAATLSIAVIAVEIGVRLTDGGMTLAPALAILVLAPEFYGPLRSAAAQFHASADGLAAAGRLFELLDLEPTLAAVEEPAPPVGTIRLEDVTVVYPRGPAVEDVSATLVPGQRVALAGPSGAGKTTLLSLLLRLADPTSGRVLVDGVDLARCDPAGWRAQLAWLPQRPRLAPGTLRDALDDGRGLTDTALLAAMVRAGAPPLSLDAVLGERTPLSAGEIRRLALARALALPKPLLLLDEPTTSLDPASADTVRDAIAALPRDGLVVFATHDPELIALADVVVELAPRLREQVA